jgi:hypothetical protein
MNAVQYVKNAKAILADYNARIASLAPYAGVKAEAIQMLIGQMAVAEAMGRLESVSGAYASEPDFPATTENVAIARRARLLLAVVDQAYYYVVNDESGAPTAGELYEKARTAVAADLTAMISGLKPGIQIPWTTVLWVGAFALGVVAFVAYANWGAPPRPSKFPDVRDPELGWRTPFAPRLVHGASCSSCMR